MGKVENGLEAKLIANLKHKDSYPPDGKRQFKSAPRYQVVRNLRTIFFEKWDKNSSAQNIIWSF